MNSRRHKGRPEATELRFTMRHVGRETGVAAAMSNFSLILPRKDLDQVLTSFQSFLGRISILS